MKYLFKSFTHFFIGLFAYYSVWKHSLYTLDAGIRCIIISSDLSSFPVFQRAEVVCFSEVYQFFSILGHAFCVVRNLCLTLGHKDLHIWFSKFYRF